MIETAPDITTSISLIAFIVAVIATAIIAIKKIRSQNKIELLKNSQKQNDIKALEVILDTFHIPISDLTQKQKYDIAIKQLTFKYKRLSAFLWFSGIMAFLLAVLIGIVLLNPKETNAENHSFLFDKNTPFEKIQEQYKILILPFYKKSSDYQIEERLKKRFLELNAERGLNLAVKLISYNNDIDFQKAEDIGKQYNADIVLFGDFDIDAHKVKLCYVIINKPINELESKGGTEYVKLDGVSDISQGYLQEDVEDLIYWTLGMQALKKKEYQKGLEYFENINHTNNFTIQELVKKALIICYIKTTNAAEIKDLYNLPNEINKDSNLYFDLAYFCGQYLNDNELTITLYRHNELNYGSYSAPYNNIAIAYKNDGDYLSAEKYYKLAIKQNESALCYSNLAELYTSDFFKKYDLSEKLYLKAIQLDSLNPDYHNYLGNFYCLDSIKQYDKAKNYFLKSIKINPNYLQSYFNIADLYSEYYNKIDSAKYYLDMAYKIDNNNSDVFYNYGKLYQYHSRQYEKAKKYYTKAIELDGTNAIAYDRLGDVYRYNYKMNWKAEENYRIALSISPDNSSFNNSLGILLCDDYKKYDEALSCFQKALSKKDLSNLSKAIYLTNCGNVYINQNKYSDAEKYYLEALKCDSSYLSANYNLYTIYDKTGKYEKAIQYYKNVCQINPEYKFILYVMSLKLKQLFKP